MNELNNLDQARFNMVEQQIRPAEVLDPHVLSVIENTPRDAFVAEKYKGLAFADTHIPINDQEVMMTPIQEARMLQALDLRQSDTVLEIGTGSAFLTALLAQQTRQVTSVEIEPSLAEAAKKRLAAQKIDNITLEIGDGSKGWPKEDGYDVIAVTGSMPKLADELKNQLTVGGRLCVIVGTEPVMEFLLITRISDSQWQEECLFETLLPKLKNVDQPPEFVF